MAQKKVLLVEDDLEIRDILQDLLEAEGYDFHPAVFTILATVAKMKELGRVI